MMAKMTKKRPVIRITLAIDGIALKSELMLNFKPWFLLITLTGLSTRNILRILNTLRSTSVTVRDAIENVTTKKSRIFCDERRYESGPLRRKP